jgi:hypothetical protein
VLAVSKPLVGGAERLTLARDDTPTQRYAPHVPGAGVQHNPTPGPAGSPYVFGHVFVVLGLRVRHPAWGVIALPLWTRMSVRATDRVGIDLQHRPEFRTQRERAVARLRWATRWLGLLPKPRWAVVDGAYAQRPFLKEARAWDVTVVSRLRGDAALWSVPGPASPGRRGPAPTSGNRRLTLAQRAGPRRGGSTGVFDRYGGKAVQRSKTLLATWRPAGGLIRVVLVEEPSGGVACFGTDPEARGAWRVAPRSGSPSPIGSRSRRRSGTARRSSGRASRRCGEWGRASERSSCACGPTRGPRPGRGDVRRRTW